MAYIQLSQPAALINDQGLIIIAGAVEMTEFDGYSYEFSITTRAGITPDQFEKPRRVETVADLRISDIGKRIRIEYAGTNIAGELLDFTTNSEFNTIRNGPGQIVREIVDTTVKICLPIATITVSSTAKMEVIA